MLWTLGLTLGYNRLLDHFSKPQLFYLVGVLYTVRVMCVFKCMCVCVRLLDHFSKPQLFYLVGEL